MKNSEFICSGHVISKDRNEPSEDAVFTHPNALGVADGVGGWIKYGISSSKFSNELMLSCFNEVNKRDNTEKLSDSVSEDSDEFSHECEMIQRTSTASAPASYLEPNKRIKSFNTHSNTLDPKVILEEAYKHIKSAGSSTAWVCTLDKNTTTLKVANLGDSGFLILRQNKFGLGVVAESKEQQHCFNTPYQLTNIPRRLIKKHKIPGFYNDQPSDADIYQFKCQKGDIVILASDGVFDNLYTNEIVKVISKYLWREQKDLEKTLGYSHLRSGSIIDWLDTFDAKEIAKNLAMKAWQTSASTNCISPFGEKVNHLLKSKSPSEIKIGVSEWKGGKQDDISVVVGIVS